jgi:hypothetical protein
MKKNKVKKLLERVVVDDKPYSVHHVNLGNPKPNFTVKKKKNVKENNL